MSEPRLRSWSLDERIADFERRGRIKSPFSAAERGLARNLAAAFYFWEYQGELPDRALEQPGEEFWTDELFAFDMGIQRVRKIRGELNRSTSLGTRR